MANYTRIQLSADTAGAGLLVTGINPTGGLAFHVAPAGVSKYDELHVWAQCHVTVATHFDIWIGGATCAVAGTRRIRCRTTGGGDLGLLYVVPGFTIRSQVTCRAFVDAVSTNNDWSIYGFCNRYTT